MANIKHKVLVLSGKGGVGKSSIAVNLAVWLSMHGKEVGLLDVDIHGPSVPRLLGMKQQGVEASGEVIEPIAYGERLKVMSVGLLLPSDNEAVIWRGPMKHNLINQFINEVEWGGLDYLIVDCPPGTGDEPLSVAQVLSPVDGAVVVTTPQDLAVLDVRRCLTFCKQLGFDIIGVIENMSGFVCPHCNTRTDVFAGQGARQMADDFGAPLLGSIPIDPALAALSDAGRPFVLENTSPTAQALAHAFGPVLKLDSDDRKRKEHTDTMKIAVPLADGKLAMHFGHCGQFAVIDVDTETKAIGQQELLTPPPHEPGVLPRWLAEQDVKLIIAGGMGRRAQDLFAQSGIEVLVGAPAGEPEDLVRQYLDGTLTCGTNVCDH